MRDRETQRGLGGNKRGKGQWEEMRQKEDGEKIKEEDKTRRKEKQ